MPSRARSVRNTNDYRRRNDSRLADNGSIARGDHTTTMKRDFGRSSTRGDQSRTRGDQVTMTRERSMTRDKSMANERPVATEMMTTRRKQLGDRKRESEMTMMARLRPPPGFNFRPYRCCCCRVEHALLVCFVLSIIFGIVLLAGGATAAVLHIHYFSWIVAGGVVSLISAALCLLMMWSSTRCAMLVYLTETIMELVLVIFCLFVLSILLLTIGEDLKWTTKAKGDQWMSSKTIVDVIEKAATKINMKPSLLVGLSFLPIFGFLVLLLIRLVILYHFFKYVDDKSEFLSRQEPIDNMMPRHRDFQPLRNIPPTTFGRSELSKTRGTYRDRSMGQTRTEARSDRTRVSESAAPSRIKHNEAYSTLAIAGKETWGSSTKVKEARPKMSSKSLMKQPK